MGKRLEIQLYNAKTGESITLPLNPETTDIPTEKDIKTYNILDFGEISVKGIKRLKRLNLTNILPDSTSALSLLASLIRQLQYKPYNLQETIDMIDRWVDEDAIIRVIISEKLNAEFRVERLIESVRESVRDVGYIIDLIEYKDPSKKETVPVMNAAETSVTRLKKRTINKFIPNQQVAQRGMTIYKLAKLTYGGRSQELANLNAITNQNASIAGQVVEMLPL
ncbi:MAG: hypothetical protein KHX03_09630 [Clostridium sp.]|nr:hypothetical protein [Clostridium sp.]